MYSYTVKEFPVPARQYIATHGCVVEFAASDFYFAHGGWAEVWPIHFTILKDERVIETADVFILGMVGEKPIFEVVYDYE